ncbi:MAG TPA: carboxypeptidase regulatory-like domain-containing protein, partial [Thermoplasmatales archaeon]|nr:carboxypeptidase regulatory-like domain-containing protein [Thermoplasmatales archaeon]
SYEEGTEVTLTAIANEGYIFDHWSEDLSGDENPVTITMNSDKTIVAHFVEETIPSELQVEITRPELMSIYFNDQLIFFTLSRCIIIGPITIEANVISDTPVDRVEFYIKDPYSDSEELKYTASEPPYTYTWDEFAIGQYTIVVRAYDIDTNMAEDSINVTIFNLNLDLNLSLLPTNRNTTEENDTTETTRVDVTGKVLDYSKLINRRIAGALVVAYREEGSDLVEVDRDTTGRLFINKGRYHLLLEPGYEYYIEVSAKGYEAVGKYVYVPENGTTGLDFYLNKTVCLKGKVMRKGLLHRGIVGANITAIGENGKTYTTTSRFLGKYSLYLPPGNYTIIVSAEGYQELEKSIIVKHRFMGRPTVINFKLTKAEEETS